MLLISKNLSYFSTLIFANTFLYLQILSNSLKNHFYLPIPILKKIFTQTLFMLTDLEKLLFLCEASEDNFLFYKLISKRLSVAVSSGPFGLALDRSVEPSVTYAGIHSGNTYKILLELPHSLIGFSRVPLECKPCKCRAFTLFSTPSP